MLNKLPALFPWKHNKTKIMAEQQQQAMEEAVSLEHELLPCVICGRTFLPIPLAKHTKVCERNATRKRKVFDSLKQRVEGTDLAPFHQKSYLKKAEVSVTPKSEARQSKWKEKHLELVNAIRAAKGSTPISMPSTLAKRSSTTLGTPTHERCPSCDRQFGPKAFDRHVEWCKEKKTTIHKSPASVILAKERLEARTKYKVPPLTKSKRALTREKYSPQTNSRTEAIVNMKSVSACTLDRSPSVRKSKNLLHGKKSVDRMAENVANQVEQVAEKIIREKNVGDSSVKIVQSDKNLNVKKVTEPLKSIGKRLIFNKINTISVNDDVTGLTVSSLSFGESDSRKLVTWKDTIKSSKSENIPVISKSKNVVETPSGRNRNGCDKDVQLETFSNLANQSKSRKGDNCTFKVVVKEKKSEEIDDNKKKQQESVGVKRIKSPDRKIKGDRPVSSRLSTSRLTPKKNERDASNNILQNQTVHRQIRNPHIKRRLPAGTNSSKPHTSKDKSLISKENFTGFILDQENEDITIKIDICNPPTMQIEDLDNNVFLDEHTEDAGIVSDSLDTEDSILVKEEEIVFTNSRDIVLYDEEFNPGSDANIYDTEYYKNQLSALKTQLSSIENNVRMNWRDDFLEGEAYEETISKRSSPRDKIAKFRSDSLRSSRKGSASKSGNRSPRIRTPRCGNSPESKYSDYPRKTKSRSSSLKKSADKKSFLRSSSDVMLDKKESSRSKIPLSKHLKSPKSLSTTPRIRLKQPTSPIPTEKCNTTILSARGDKMMIDSTSRCISRQTSPTGSPHRKHLSKSRHASPRERRSENKITSKADSPIQETTRRIKKIKRAKSNINSKESSPRSGAVVTSSKFNEDNIVTQYQRCKALCQDKKIEKVNSGDVGVSCLTRFRRDSKIVNCQRFLERNKLVEVDLKSPASSSDDTDTYCFPDKLAMDVCCQTSSIEGIATTVANKEELQNGEENRRMVDDGMTTMVERNNRKDQKKEAYFDSLDGSSSESINSDVFKEIDEVLAVIESNKERASSVNKDLKTKSSKSNMLFVRSSEDCFSEDSVVDGCESYHSHALSVARIERGLRKCASDVCLRRNSETSFASYTEIDLRKLSSYECTSIQCRVEDSNLTSDEILEIASEQFLQSLKNNSRIKTSTPISQRKARSPNISDCVPLKRRKLDHLDDDDTEERKINKAIITKDKKEQISLDAAGDKVGKECVVELRKNIQQIKEKKKELQNLLESEHFKELVKNSSNYFSTNSGIEDDIVSQVEVDAVSSNSVEIKRILSTIEEASSNTSSGLINRISSNYNAGNRNDGKKNDETNKEVREEGNLIDLDNDCTHITNGYRFISNPSDILEPVRVSDIPHKKSTRFRKKTKNQSKYTLTDVATKPRPVSAEFASDLSPRFLHLIRTIINPQATFTPKTSYCAAEEDFLKISRAHCRKLLQLDTQKLNHILESEPLKLPKITTVSTVRGVPKGPKKIIKLPPIGSASGSSNITAFSPNSSSNVTPRKGGKILPLLGPDFCKSKIPVRETKADAYSSEPDLLDPAYVVMGLRYNLSPRPNSSLTNSTHSDGIIDYNPFVSAERQLMELLECDEFKTTPPPPPSTVQNTPRPHTTTTKITSKSFPQKKKSVKSANPKLEKNSRKIEIPAVPKRASVIDPPLDFRDRLSMLNDDFDAIENMIKCDTEKTYSNKFYAKCDNNSFSLNAILNRRKYSDDLSTIDPCLINENDNLSIPDDLHIDDTSPISSSLDNNFYELGNRYEEIDHFSENFDNKMSSIEPDGTEIKLKQSISMFDDERFFESGNIDEFVIALSESSIESKVSVNVKNSCDKIVSKPKKPIRSSKLPKSTEKSNVSDHSSFGYAASAKDQRKKHNLASLKRSISLLDPVQKPKTLKNKQDVQNYFNEQELKSPVKTEKVLIAANKEETPTAAKLPEDSLFVPKADELFSVDDEMYEEYKKYEEMYLKEKEEQMKKDERRISDGQSGLLTASEDDESQQQSIKLSGDSAYGSLNRKTPKVRARSTKLTPLESQRNLAAESPNSSSSESSPVIPLTPPAAPKMSKFCHECGNRYPVATAKFCVECGIKRAA